MHAAFIKLCRYIKAVRFIANDNGLKAPLRVAHAQHGVFEQRSPLAQINKLLGVGFTGKGPQACAAAAAQNDWSYS
jgi:hypothetical protein